MTDDAISRIVKLGVSNSADGNMRRATGLLGRKIRSGAVKRGACCVACGEDETQIVGHHWDYLKPLMVIWLCQSCHIVVHRNLRAPQTRIEYRSSGSAKGQLQQRHLLQMLSYRLRVARERRTNRGTAKAMGCHESTLGRYLSKPGTMNLRTYINLCGEYGVDPDHLFTVALADARR